MKALKAEVAALERKIQLTLAPSTPETAQEQIDNVHLENGQRGQQPKTVKLDAGDSLVRNHIHIIRSENVKEQQQYKGVEL
mgnify:CR=1 FL=1